ncbi:MAG TPA: tRNA-dihydrouridine synthase, partial [Bacteroidales bacterium]|nr:tRNA-dihydrouridine synthase [Bacteroidales bacterium]
LVIEDSERPIGIQIYGHIAEALLQAALIAQEARPDVIDINFGCPKNKIAKRGAGSGWLRDPEGMVDITRRLVRSVKVPVTVKTRLGWDENTIIIEHLAEALQDVGIAALTIHGRTRAQMYKGKADWAPIGRVKANPRIRIPIIGNGDICTPQQARQAFDTYGVDGIMIGRASFGHPWLFREIRHYLQTGRELPPMGVVERVSLAKRHLSKSLEVKGERVGVLEMRRHLNSYFKGLADFKPVRLKLVTENDPQQLFAILDHIAERWG